MVKKLTLFGMTIAAIAAFAMPATAGASPQLFEGATALAKGATIVGTSTNAVTTDTALGTLTCATVEITAALDANSGTHIAAHGTSGKTATCHAGGAPPLVVTKPTLISLTTTAKDEGSLSLTFIADVGPFECHFEGTGSFKYTTGTDVLNIPGITLKTAEVCETEDGQPKFEGDFTITTSNPAKTPVTIK